MLMLSIALMALLSCKKEDRSEEVSWNRSSNSFLFFNSIPMNSLADSNRLLVLGRDRLVSSTFNETHSGGLDHWRFVVDVERLLLVKMPLTKNVFTVANRDTLRFYPTGNPIGNGPFVLPMKSIDSNFREFDMPYFGHTEAIGLNNKLQCIIPYKTKETNGLASFETHFLWVQLRQNSNMEIDMVSAAKLSLPDGIIRLKGIHTINDAFYLSGTDKTVKVNPDKSTVVVSSADLKKIVHYQGLLYAFTDNALLRSSDDGINWQVIKTMDFKETPNLVVINNALIAYLDGALYHVMESGDNVTFKKLDNSGLPNEPITSLVLFRHQVFATTLSGVFNKHYADFISPD